MHSGGDNSAAFLHSKDFGAHNTDSDLSVFDQIKASLQYKSLWPGLQRWISYLVVVRCHSSSFVKEKYKYNNHELGVCSPSPVVKEMRN
jgi:hypothetical protein